MNGSTERYQQFVEEAKDLLDLVEQNLLALEEAGEVDLSVVNEIFRSIHTLKGGADFLGLGNFKELSHAAEDLLDKVRKESLKLNEHGISTMLVVTDSLKEMLNDIEKSTEIDISRLLEDIRTIAIDSPENIQTTSASEIMVGTLDAPDLFAVSRKQYEAYNQDGFSFYILALDEDCDKTGDEIETVLSSLVSIGYIIDSKTARNSSDDKKDAAESDSKITYILYRSVLTRTTTLRYLSLDPRCLHEIKPADMLSIQQDSQQEMLVENDSVGERRLERRADRRRSTRDRRDGSAGDRRGVATGAENISAGAGLVEDYDEESLLASGNAANGSLEYVARKTQAVQSIRVNVEILDNLMNLVGELVLTRNQLNQNVEHNDYELVNATAQRLDIVTSELQESIMATRMQPLGNILSKFHRIIRDMSNQLGKSVSLALEGEDVELDKSIIENISDPLTHLVRNAIDHGIENPEERHKYGKALNATLSIKARQEAGHVVIEVSDDGKGIDKEKVKARAIQAGLLEEDKADEITEKELLKLIFSPGFSTADKISDISGRGVGLDVVFTNISKMGGAIDVDTDVGVGTTFRVALPLTLAIVPSLLVSCKGDTFAIPQINLVELVRIPAEQTSQKIKFLGDAAVMRLRESLLPIVWLDDVVGLGKASNWQEMTTNVAVVFSGEFHYGIVVDQFTDSEEIVVKPLGKHLKSCHAYASATILGDGSAALILDVNGIGESVNMPGQSEIELATAEQSEDDVIRKAENAVGNESSLLVVEDTGGDFFGVELAYVNRIERIRRGSVERMLDKNVVKYRGGVLRVFNLNVMAENRQNTSDDEQVYLIVFYLMGTEVAVMVSNIVDIVESGADVEESAIRGAGIVGTSIIMDRITLIVDLFELVRSQDPDLSMNEVHGKAALKSGDTNKTILVVEDSVFFQDKLKALLKDMEMNVLVAEDGEIGYEMLNSHRDEVDLVLMDVEMPKMTGLELSRLIRSEQKYNGLPIIMLTSLAREDDIEEGLRSGANEYLVKMDQEMVKSAIYRQLRDSNMAEAVH